MQTKCASVFFHFLRFPIEVNAQIHVHCSMAVYFDFREDLWFRLNVFPIMIPPLRQRKEDIPALVNYSIERKSNELKLQTSPKLAIGAIDRLTCYRWPGNVRELENVVERELILNKDGPLRFDKFIKVRQEAKPPALSAHENEPLNLDEVISSGY